MTENEFATVIVDTAFHIHYDLGPGLFESVYERIMEAELRKRGLLVFRQKAIPVVYGGLHFEAGFRADLLVGSQIHRSTASSSQEASADLLEIRGQEIGPADKLQCGADKRRDSETREQVERVRRGSAQSTLRLAKTQR